MPSEPARPDAASPLSVAAYRARVFDLVSPLRRTVTVSLTDAARHAGPLVLAADVVSPMAVPPFDNSQMDGFAVSCADVAGAGVGTGITARAGERGPGLTELPLMPMVTAGSLPPSLLPGHAMPIMTGGRIPTGADCVIPVEETERGFGHCADAGDVYDGSAGTVRFTSPLAAIAGPGRFVRAAGSDTAAGESVTRAGALLNPALIGVLASVGLRECTVFAPLRIALVSTGDEVVAPGAARGPAQIYDANSVAATAALTAAGARVEHVVRVPDDPSVLLERVAQVRGDVDLVVSMGGISKGAKEVLRLAAEREGRSGTTGAAGGPGLAFTSVAMQPGGPQGCGTLAGLPWIAAPGNPVSTLVTIEMFIRPALLGIAPGTTPRPCTRARLAAKAGTASPAGKTQVRRAVLAGDGTVALQGGPSSHLLGAYARANALAFVPVGVDRIEPGDELEVWSIS